MNQVLAEARRVAEALDAEDVARRREALAGGAGGTDAAVYGLAHKVSAAKAPGRSKSGARSLRAAQSALCGWTASGCASDRL